MDVLSTTCHTDPPGLSGSGLTGSASGGIGGELAEPQWWRNPAAALVALERAAERDPADRRLAAAVSWAVDRIAVEAATADVVGGVRRERLVRWDAHSAVWVGAGPGGAPAMVRALRPLAAADPAWHRAQRREARALAGVVEVEVVEGGDGGPVLRTPLLGRPLSECRIARGDLARPLLTGLGALARWERAGLGLPPLAPEELRLHPGGAAVVCLWPVSGTTQPALSALATLLLRAAGDRGEDEADRSDVRDLAGEALLPRLRALAEHDSTAADAGRLAREALAEGLAARRHALAAAWREVSHRSRSVRLLDAVIRLQAALPPPAGRGPVGTDVDGEVIGVTSDGAEIRSGRWGDADAADEAALVYGPEAGFRPVEARRLLRVRAVSPPPGPGPADETEAICRWIAAGLQLRTVRMLLQREVG